MKTFDDFLNETQEQFDELINSSMPEKPALTGNKVEDMATLMLFAVNAAKTHTNVQLRLYHEWLTKQLSET